MPEKSWNLEPPPSFLLLSNSLQPKGEWKKRGEKEVFFLSLFLSSEDFCLNEIASPYRLQKLPFLREGKAPSILLLFPNGGGGGQRRELREEGKWVDGS